MSALPLRDGFSGHGFLQGPAVGEIVRDLVLGASRSSTSRRSRSSGSPQRFRPEHNVI